MIAGERLIISTLTEPIYAYVEFIRYLPDALQSECNYESGALIRNGDIRVITRKRGQKEKSSINGERGERARHGKCLSLSLTCKFLKRFEPHNELRNLLRAHFGVRCVIPAFTAASAMDSLPVVGAMPTSEPLAICK